MKEYNKSFAILSVRNKSEIPEGYPEEPIKQLAKNDLKWAAENRSAILDKWINKYDSKSEPKK